MKIRLSQLLFVLSQPKLSIVLLSLMLFKEVILILSYMYCFWRNTPTYLPTYLPTFLIYKFECSNCNITYYDETERHLKVRAGEHISTSPLTGKRVNNNKKCSVKDTAFCQVTCVHLKILLS